MDETTPPVGTVEAALREWSATRHAAEWELTRAHASNYAELTERTRTDLRQFIAEMMPGAVGITWGMEGDEVSGEDVGAALLEIVAAARETAVALGWKPEREAVPPRLRTLVYRRDGYQCVLCGLDDVLRLTIDHRIPVDLGGDNSPENLRTLCKSCNSQKGARL
jgi:hypothetical protein